MRSIVVRAIWDEEANVWVAESADVPGLVAEAATLDELSDILHTIIPELLDENAAVVSEGVTEVPLYVMAEHLSKVRVSL